MTFRTRRHTARPAFSLIEIVAVILLIGILAAGAAVAVLPQVARARVNATKNSMQTIRTQINSYMVEHSAPPSSLQVLVGPYLEPGSDVDAWGTPYYYRVTASGDRPYELISAGPDRDFSTPEDNINVWDLTSGSN
ncbi:MAG: type II secretion system protein GspG [Phycisphaerales bacterium]|nr:type II secretion system protein GspG [Planctomycetota bacterium]MCH8508871.1 type II secretion system protein GspG [Phycisphaerales bacterium]